MLKRIIIFMSIAVICVSFVGFDDDRNETGKTIRSGLVAHYYKDPLQWDGNWVDDKPGLNVSPDAWTFSNYSYSRVEPLINHQFMKNGWFSVRWQGTLVVPVPKNLSKRHMRGPNNELAYQFEIWADDGCRLLIDGKPVIDSWTAKAEDSDGSHRKATIDIAPGSHTIVVEYFQGLSLKENDKDPMKLYWSCIARKVPKQIIPAAYFKHSVSDITPQDGRLD